MNDTTTPEVEPSTGTDPALFVAPDFILLRMALVDDLDGDHQAAIVLQRMMWRCERDGEWVASLAQIAAETRFPERTVRRIIERLRAGGRITSRRVGAYDPTQVWTVVLAGHHVVANVATTVVANVAITSLEDVKTNPPTPQPHRTTQQGTAERGMNNQPRNPTPPAAAGRRPHPTEANTRRALDGLGKLPIEPDVLMVELYRIGAGDPWAGYLMAKPHLLADHTGSRDPSKVLAARLRAIPTAQTTHQTSPAARTRPIGAVDGQTAPPGFRDRVRANQSTPTDGGTR